MDRYGPGHLFVSVSVHSQRISRIESQLLACKTNVFSSKMITPTIQISLPFVTHTMVIQWPVYSGSLQVPCPTNGLKSLQQRSWWLQPETRWGYGSIQEMHSQPCPILLGEHRVQAVIVLVWKLLYLGYVHLSCLINFSSSPILAIQSTEQFQWRTVDQLFMERKGT